MVDDGDNNKRKEAEKCRWVRDIADAVRSTIESFVRSLDTRKKESDREKADLGSTSVRLEGVKTQRHKDKTKPVSKTQLRAQESDSVGLGGARPRTAGRSVGGVRNSSAALSFGPMFKAAKRASNADSSPSFCGGRVSGCGCGKPYW